MNYILIFESVILLFYLVKFLDSKTKLNNEKMKTKERSAFFERNVFKESEEEKKFKKLLENIENYATENKQQEI